MGEELTKNNYDNNYIVYVDINEIAKHLAKIIVIWKLIRKTH